MKCGECRFNLLCWSGRLGNGSRGAQNSMNICPACERLTLHFLDCPTSLLLGEDEVHGESVLLQHKLRRHFVFYCEHRYLTANKLGVWDKHYTQRGVEIAGYYERAPLTSYSLSTQFIVPGSCEVRPCYPCARYTPRDLNSQVLELERPCAA